MKLVIRADAGPQLGSGHLMRCIALGQAWTDQGIGSVEVVCSESPSTCHEQLRAEGWPVHLLGPVGSDADIEATSAQARGAALVLDGYQFDHRYQRVVRAATTAMLVVDYNGKRNGYDCDLLLNQNPHASVSLYPSIPETRLLLGIEYAMLRREFRDSSERPFRNTSSPTRLLVTLGGSQTQLGLSLVLRALLALNSPILQPTIVVGSPNTDSEIVELAAQLGARILHSPNNMAEIMAFADVAITAGGSTLYETLFMGVPTACLVIADNQLPGSGALADRGLVRLLGRLEELDLEALSGAIADWLSKPTRLQLMAEDGRRSVDGLGAIRVARRLAEAAGAR